MKFKNKIILVFVAVMLIAITAPTMANTGLDNATPLTSGVQVSGAITATETQNWYSITLPTAGRLIVNISSTTGGMGMGRAYVNWFDETSIIEADAINTGDFYPSLLGDYNSTMYLEAGTYYIKVSQRDTYVGTYNITATFTPANNVQAGATPNTAYSLTSGEQATGFISHQNTANWYKIELPTAGRLIVNLAPTTGGMIIFRARVHWHDEASTIEADTINTGDFYPSLLGNYNSTMYLEAGTYYIKVGERENSRGTYNLTATFTPANNIQAGATPNTAFSLTAGEQATGFVSHQNTANWYKIELPTAGRLIVNLAPTTGGMVIYRAYVNWFDEASTIEADTINTGDFYPSLLGNYNSTMLLEQGIYYIKVGERENSRGTYNLTATFTPNCNSESGFDLIKITNTIDKTVSTKGLFLSDDENNLFKWQLPSIIMRANDSIIIKVNENDIGNVLKRSQANFDFTTSEVLRLTSADGRALRCRSKNGECVCDTA